MTINITTLFTHLWEAANILRGPVDAADFKTYIFPLLFFKRLSDVYDEEYAVALEESDGDVEFAQFPENHRFQVPEGCHWKDVRAKSANIGHALQQAMRCIEQANPDTLHGIFGDAQWTNKDRLSDALLKDLIEHFSSLNLGNEYCKADILGQAYEYLIGHVDNIHRWYQGYQDVEGVCRVVTLDEIRENDFNLNIPRYVEPVIEEESMTIDQAIANLKESLQAAYAAEDRLKGLLKQNGLLS